ncbi:MAG: hypothetical protein U9Q38_06390 [Thermodesulfobacteriota bacterium]|nr:hypothetical protein [Thermodesulfobacteriota bacterium]
MKRTTMTPDEAIQAAAAAQVEEFEQQMPMVRVLYAIGDLVDVMSVDYTDDPDDEIFTLQYAIEPLKVAEVYEDSGEVLLEELDPGVSGRLYLVDTRDIEHAVDYVESPKPSPAPKPGSSYTPYKPYKPPMHHKHYERCTSELAVNLIAQSTLDAIGQLCLPTAKGSEFQVHMRSLLVRIHNGTSGDELIVNIPLTFYNFNQEVSSATIEYELKDVNERGALAAPSAEALANAYLAKSTVFTAYKAMGFTVDMCISDNASIHRHPAGCKGFSSTDLDLDRKSPGVIGRVADAKDFVQMDSILYDNNGVGLYTSECRIVDTNAAEGSWVEVPTITYIHQDTPSPFDWLAPEQGDYTTIYSSMTSHTSYGMVKPIVNEFMKIAPEVDLSDVVASRITQAPITHYTKRSGKKSADKSYAQKLADAEWHDFMQDMY